MTAVSNPIEHEEKKKRNQKARLRSLTSWSVSESSPARDLSAQREIAAALLNREMKARPDQFHPESPSLGQEVEPVYERLPAPKDVQSDLDKLSPDASQETFAQLVMEYQKPEELKLIVERAATVLSTLDYIRILVLIIDSYTIVDQDELLDEIVNAFTKVPTSLDKLNSLVSTENSVRKWRWRYSRSSARVTRRGRSRIVASKKRLQYLRRLDAQIIQVAAKLVATALDCDDVNQADRALALVKHSPLGVKACLQAALHVQTNGAKQILLSKALDQAQSVPLSNNPGLEINLLGEIKTAALEAGAFEDAGFAKQFIEEYVKLPDVKPTQIIQEVLCLVASPYDRVHILIELLTSTQLKFHSDLWQIVVATYLEIPASVEKLRSLVRTSITVRSSHPQYAAQLGNEAVDLGCVLMVTFIERDLADEVCQTIGLLGDIDSRVATVTSVTPKPGDQSINPLLLTDVMRVASLFTEHSDLQGRLLNAVKGSALRNGLFHDVDFTTEFVNECMRIPGVEVSQEIEEILGVIENPSERLSILHATVPKVDRQLAIDLATKSLETISSSSFLDHDRRKHLQDLLSLCHSHQLLEDQGLCRDLTLTLADNGEFRDAREMLSQHVAVSKQVALSASTKTPGFALHALRSALESESDMAYSEQHAQILANITQQIAKYSPRLAHRVWQQSLEFTRRIAPGIDSNRQRRMFYKSYSSPQSKALDPENHGSGGDGFGSIAVRIVFDAEIEDFIENKEELFITALADMLRLAREDVIILNRSAGSAVYKITLPSGWICYVLKDKFETQDEDFREFQEVIGVLIESVDLISIPLEQVMALREALTALRTGIIEIEVTTQNGAARVCVRSSDGGKASSDSPLPYDSPELITILKVLEYRTLDERHNWKPEQIEYLHQEGFLRAKPRAVADLWTGVKFYLQEAVAQRNFKQIFDFLRWHRSSTVLEAAIRQVMNIDRPWQSSQIRILWELNLLTAVALVPNYAEKIGDKIFNGLLASKNKMHHILQSSIDESRRKEIAWQLEVEEKDTNLARYPWELVRHEQQHLLLDNSLKLDLARSVELCHPASPLRTSPPLKILYIESRPFVRADGLPETQRRTIEDVLRNSIQRGEIDLEVLSTSHRSSPAIPPTYSDIIDQIQAHQYHVIHFDGHGRFGRKCPNCGNTFYPHYAQCAKCSTELDQPQGNLQIEDLYKQPDWVDSEDLCNLLGKKHLRLVVLSACSSAQVYGETVFSGIAPALLRCGVPCVVGMQFSIYDQHANTFMETFYKSLAESGNVRRAMHAGRQKLSRNGSWYIPVLYLRSLDVTGQLFNPRNQQGGER